MKKKNKSTRKEKIFEKMLGEYRQLYKSNIQNLDILSLDKNELVRQFVETKKEEYLSAAIYKFWYILTNKVSRNTNNKFIEPEEFYNMYVDSVMDTCNKALWNKPEHTLYNDLKAPEKSINVMFNSRIINYFHACNRQKRKSSFEKISLTDYTPNASTSFEIERGLKEKKLSSIIRDFFEAKDYYSAYILDLIINGDTFDIKDGKFLFNKKKLKKNLMNIGEEYCNYFADQYNIDKEKVLYSLKYLNGISYDSADKKISNSMETLKLTEVLQYLKGE